MDRTLRVIDLMSYIHAGSVNTHATIDGDVISSGGKYLLRDIQAGGASLVFNLLYYNFGKCDFVFCSDRNPTIKKEMYPAYKSSRVHKNHINIQRDVAEFILKDCGFDVLYGGGYEADDYIYSIVQKFKPQYDKIFVHTGDSDLYFLVDDKVSIAKSHSRTKEVTMENYETQCKKGQRILYNTNEFNKVLYGDTSDSIPPLPDEQSEYLWDIFHTEFYNPKMGDKFFVRTLLESVAPWALPQFDLVYPLLTDTPNDIKHGNKELVRKWGIAMKNKLFSQSYNGDITEDPHISECVRDMLNMGLYTD